MTTVAAARPGRPPKPMSAWRLERLRMTRTPRAIALGAVYLFFGLLGPVTARYLQDIVNHAQSGVQVIIAHPTAKDGIANYISQASQTGLVVVVVIARAPSPSTPAAGCPPSCAPALITCGSSSPPLLGQCRCRGRGLHPGDAGRMV
jgi:hypothetical protein